MKPETPPLSPTMPPDATFRALGKLCAARALSEEPPEGATDLRPAWRFLRLTCTQLAQLARQFPPELLAQFSAREVATMLTAAIRSTPVDTQQRAAWRTGYGLLLSVLQEAGVLPAQDSAGMTLACALWACLQQTTLDLARSDLRPRMVGANTDPAAEAQALRRRLFELREMLISDWAEVTMLLAGGVALARERAAQQGADLRAQRPDLYPQGSAPVAQEGPADGR